MIYNYIFNKNFNSKEEELKYEKYVFEIKKIYDKLIDIDFFYNDDILIKGICGIMNFGTPYKNDFNFKEIGYIRIYGYEEHDNVFIRFKLRNNKLICLVYDEENKTNEYLKTIFLDKIFKEEYRNKKIKKIYGNSI